MTASTFPPPPKVRESRFDDWMWRFYKHVDTQAGSSSPLAPPYFKVTTYGAVGDGVTDDTLALQAAASAISNAGGGTLWFEPNRTYKVWTTSPSTLFSFTSLFGVTILGNGSTIDTAQTNASYVDVFKLNGCSSVHICDLEFLGSNTTLTASTGERFVNYHNDCRNITVERCRVYNCRSGLEAAGSPGGTRTKGVRVLDCYFERVYYPLQPYRTDHLEARYTSVNAGRSYFPTSPCAQHDVWIDAQQGGPFTDCLIKVYAGSAETAATNTISDIRLNYFTSGRYASSGDQNNDEAIVAFEIEQADASTAAGHLRNIDVNITADCGASDQFSNLVTFRRYDYNVSTVTADGTTRSHSIRNIRISGNATNWDNARQNGVVLFATTTVNSVAMNWTGDTIDGIVLRDLNISGTPPTYSLAVNGQGFSDSTQSLLLDNVNLSGPVNYANVSAGRIAKRAFVASNENNLDCEGEFTPGISFGGGTTGITYAAREASYTKRGNRYHASGYIALSNKGSSTGAAKITGLPFTTRNDNDAYSPPTLYLVNITFTGQHQALPDLNATTIAMNQVSEAGTASSLTDTNFANDSVIVFSFTGRVT